MKMMIRIGQPNFTFNFNIIIEAEIWAKAKNIWEITAAIAEPKALCFGTKIKFNVKFNITVVRAI